MNRRARGAVLAGVAIAVLTASPGLAASFTDSGDPAACNLLGQPLFQVTNPSSKASLVTLWAHEATNAAQYGFTSPRATLARVANRPAEGSLVPVRRLYKAATRDFAWSASDADTTRLTSAGYRVRQVDFYASPTALPCTTPIRQMTKSGNRRLAAGDQLATLAAQGWTPEGQAFHARPATAGTSPAPSTTQPSTTQPSTTQPSTTQPSTTQPSTTQPSTTQPSTAADADGTFSLAIYPDTQMEVMSSTDHRLGNRNQYVAAQRTTRDIRYVVQVGDLVNWDQASATDPDNHTQFENASREMRSLETANIPWAAAIGNHDTFAVGPAGGSARTGVVTSEAVRDTRTFNSYFPVSRFGDIAGTFEAGKVDNAYRTFTAAGRDWMILNLELWPRATAVAWAKDVVAGHPHHNVIVVTHAYLTGDGGQIDQTNGGYGSTSAQYLYDNLIKQYPNIKLVLSGHVNTSAIRSDTGTSGNKITSILTSFHSGSTNQVRFLEIDTRNGTLHTDIYSPWTSTAETAYTASVNGMTWVD